MRIPNIVHDNRGLIALITMILVASFIVVAGLSVALMSADDILSSYASLESSKSLTSVDACADNALSRLRNNTNLTGSVNISVGNTNCTAVISGSGNTRSIDVRATTTDGFSRNLSYGVNVNVNINTNPFTIEQYKDILK